MFLQKVLKFVINFTQSQLYIFDVQRVRFSMFRELTGIIN